MSLTWLLIALGGCLDTLALWTIHLNAGQGTLATALFSIGAIGTCYYISVHNEGRIIR